MISEFKLLNTFEERLTEANKILKKYDERIPIILEKYKTQKLKSIDKKKYLVPIDLTVSQFLFVVRKRIELSSEQAIYLFCNNTLLSSNSLMGQIYDKHKDKDNFLYVYYDTENTFG